jgi:hypothetical protein
MQAGSEIAMHSSKNCLISLSLEFLSHVRQPIEQIEDLEDDPLLSMAKLGGKIMCFQPVKVKNIAEVPCCVAIAQTCASVCHEVEVPESFEPDERLVITVAEEWPAGIRLPLRGSRISLCVQAKPISTYE